MRSSTLVPYLAITFGLSWGLGLLLLLFPERITAVFGDINITNPLFLLAVYAPAIAAIALVLYHGGLAGMKRYLSRLLLWRCHPGWYVFIVIVIPLLFYTGAAIKGTLFTGSFESGWRELLAAVAMMAVIGPVEELGWRGVALPLLQQRMAPIWAGLLLGVIWAIWHLPAFYLGGTPQSEWSFLPFFISAVAISVMVTPLFNASGGSILLPALVHWQLNNPVFPDAHPHDSIVFFAAAIVVFLINSESMLSKAGAIKSVIPAR